MKSLIAILALSSILMFGAASTALAGPPHPPPGPVGIALAVPQAVLSVLIPRPVVVTPAPVYRPVVVAPAPVYRPAPVYVAPRPYYPRRVVYHHPRPYQGPVPYRAW